MDDLRKRDTRFKGAQEMPELTNKSAGMAGVGNDIRLHNYLDVIFNARINLSKLCRSLSPSETNPLNLCHRRR